MTTGLHAVVWGWMGMALGWGGGRLLSFKNKRLNCWPTILYVKGNGMKINRLGGDQEFFCLF